MTGIVYPSRAELLVPRNRGLSTADRLRTRYIIDPDGCWRWTRALTGSGYGHLSMGRVYYQAHLLMYVLEVGPLPEDLEPDHLCRHRYCVRPDHIEFVTHAVNVQRGARSFLTADQVRTIRARGKGAGVRAMAREYGVDHATISRILAGLIWIETPTAERVAA